MSASAPRKHGDTSHGVHIVHQVFGSSAIDLSVVPRLSSDRRIGGLLYVAEPVHRSLENGHCIVSLTRRHCLQIYIEFECPRVFVNEVTGFSNIVVDINDLENSDGVRDALHINVPTLLTVNLVFDESVSLISDENLAGWGPLFKPAREIYTAADDGVVHPIVAAKISDCTEPGVNSSSTTWRLFNARGSPDAIQFAHFLAHGDRHFYACHRIRLHAFGLRVAEEDEDGIADVFIYRSTKFEGDLRHLREIVVEELRQVLGFQPFSRLGETFEVREKDGQFLSPTGHCHVATTSEDRFIYLW